MLQTTLAKTNMDWSKPVRLIRQYEGNCPAIHSVKNWLQGKCILDLDHRCSDCSRIISHPSCLLAEMGKATIDVSSMRVNTLLPDAPCGLMVPLELIIEESPGLMGMMERCSRITGHIVEVALCRKLRLIFNSESEKPSYSSITSGEGFPTNTQCDKMTPDSFILSERKLIVFEFGFSGMKYVKERNDKIKWAPIMKECQGTDFTVEVRTETVDNINDIEELLTPDEYIYLRKVREALSNCQAICSKCNFWTSYDSLIAATNDGMRILNQGSLLQDNSNGTYDDYYRDFMESNGCSNTMGPMDDYEDLIQEWFENNDCGWRTRKDLVEDVRESRGAFKISVDSRIKEVNSIYEKIPIPQPCCYSPILKGMKTLLESKKPKLLSEKDDNTWRRFAHLLWTDTEMYVVPGCNDSLHVNRNRKMGAPAERFGDMPEHSKTFLKSQPELQCPSVGANVIMSTKNLLERLNSDKEERVNRVKRERDYVENRKKDSEVCLVDMEMRDLPPCEPTGRNSSVEEFLKYMKETNPFETPAVETLREMISLHPSAIPQKENVARMCLRLSTPTYRTPGAVCFYQTDGKVTVMTRRKTSGSRSFWVGGDWETFKSHPDRMFPVMNMTEASLMIQCRAKASGVDLNEGALKIITRIFEHQSKGIQVALQGMRYFWMAKNAEFYRTGLMKKLAGKTKNRIEAEVNTKIHRWMVNNAPLARDEYYSFLNEEFMADNTEFCLLEVHLCHLITKRDSSGGSSLRECFTKFLTPKLMYEMDKGMNNRLLCGVDEQKLTYDMMGDTIPLYSRSLFSEFTKWISSSSKLAVKTALNRMSEPTLSMVSNPKSTVTRKTVPPKLIEKVTELINMRLNVRRIKGVCIEGKQPDIGEVPCSSFHPKVSCFCLVCIVGRLVELDDLKEISSHAENATCLEDNVSLVVTVLDEMGADEIMTTFCRLYYPGETIDDLKKKTDLEIIMYKACEFAVKNGDYRSVALLILLRCCKRVKTPGSQKKGAIISAEMMERSTFGRSRYSTRTTTSVALNSMMTESLDDPQIIGSRESSAEFSLYFSIANKEQVGGPRELFIGDLGTKLITRRLEEVGRALTSIMKNSCLNNPEREDEFRDLLTTSLGEKSDPSILCITLDHSKWGPTQCVDAFILLLTELAGEDLGMHIDDLKRHMMKKVEIPHSYAESCIKKRMMGVDLTECEKHVIEKLKNNTPWIQSVFDMGQGILHCHSDLLGSMTEEFICDKTCEAVQERHNLERGSISVRTMNTSDDTCLYASCSVPTRGWKLSFLKYHSLFSELMNKKISPKSTCDSQLAEFKSIFVKRGSEIPVVIKFTTSCLHGLNLSNIEQLSNSALGLSIGAFNQGSTMEECRVVQSVFFKLLRFITPEVDLKKTCDLHLGLFPLPTPDETMNLSHEAIMIKELCKRIGLEDDFFTMCSTNHSLLCSGKISAAECKEGIMEMIKKAKAKDVITCLPDCELEIYAPIRPFGRGVDRELMRHLKADLEKARAVKDVELRKLQKYLDGKSASLNLKSLRRSLISAITDNMAGHQENLMQSLLTLIYQTRGRFYRAKEGFKNLKDSLREGFSVAYICDRILSLMLTTPWMIRQLSSPVTEFCSLPKLKEEECFRHFSREPNYAEDFIPEVVDILKNSKKPEAEMILMDCGVRPNKKYRSTPEKSRTVGLMLLIGEFTDSFSQGECCLRKSYTLDSRSMLPLCYMSTITDLPLMNPNTVSPNTCEMMVESFLSLVSVCDPGTDLTPQLIHQICMAVSVYLGRTEQEFMQSFMSYENPSIGIKTCRLILKTSDSQVRLKDVMKLDCSPIKFMAVDGYTRKKGNSEGGEPYRRCVWELPSRKGKINVSEKLREGHPMKMTVSPSYMGVFTKNDFDDLFHVRTQKACPEEYREEFGRLLTYVDNPDNTIKFRNTVSGELDMTGAACLKLFNGCICQSTISVMTKEQIRQFYIGNCDDLTGSSAGEPVMNKVIYEMKHYRPYAKICLNACDLLKWDLFTPFFRTLKRRATIMCEVNTMPLNDMNLFRINSKFPEMSDILSEMSTNALSCKRTLEEVFCERFPDRAKIISLYSGRLFTPDGEICVDTGRGTRIVSNGSRMYRQMISSGRVQSRIIINGQACSEFAEEIEVTESLVF
uniref:RNA-directed RNA polymerase L n=1 Tax=Trematomus arenavirus TaxID=3138838 RepID=A0AAU7LLS2_9VIRU